MPKSHGESKTLGNAVAFAVRYSFDLFLQVRSDPRATADSGKDQVTFFLCLCPASSRCINCGPSFL